MNNKLPQYEHYKPSNVEWLGDIPQHWEVKKLKDICQINRKSLPENTNKNFSFEYVDIGSVNFEKGIINTETFIFKNAPSRARRIAEIGDTIISTVRTYLKAIDYIGDSKDKYIYSTGFAILTPKETHSKYLSMAVKSDSFTNQVDIFSTGMSYPAINSTELGRLKIAIPPLSEQEKIAQFLDEKTTKIDKAIEIKQRQIELLKERRQILIHRAVTKGLDHDSKDLPNYHDLGIDNESTEILQSSKSKRCDDSQSRYRQSGVEWIGEIPEHWEVKRLKDICFINLNTLPENTNKNFEFKYVDIGSVTLEKGITETEEYIFRNSPSRARRISESGDTIISTVRTYLKAIDFIDEEKSKYIFSTGFAILHPKKNIYPQFLANFVRSDAFTEQVMVDSKGMSYPAINSTDLSRLYIVHGSIEEQKAIVSHIENISAKISKAIGLKEREIEVLKEYKSSLINSAVTGKVKIV